VQTKYFYNLLVCLFSYTVGAHTTASDALYGTLPVLTVPGGTLSSRVAAGLNVAIDMTILNAESRKEYVEVAVALNSHARPLLTKIRQHIYNALGKYIFNSQKFSKKLESAYLAAYELFPEYKHLFFRTP